MNAFDLLSDSPATLAPSASIDEAIQCMEEARTRHLPVVKDGRVIGMVSQGDILLLIGRAHGREGSTGPAPANRPLPTRVEQIMSAPVRTVGPSHSLDHIVELLLSQEFSALPVTDDEGLLGMITKSDLLRWYGDFCRDNPSNPSAGCFIRSRMQHNVVTVEAEGPAAAAYEELVRGGLPHHPVMTGKKLVGIVSDGDIRRALGWTCRAVEERNPPTEREQTGPPVDTIMSPQPMTIEPDQTMARAAGLMLEHRIGALPVVAGDALVGIITSLDVLRLIRSLVVCAAA